MDCTLTGLHYQSTALLVNRYRGCNSTLTGLHYQSTGTLNGLYADRTGTKWSQTAGPTDCRHCLVGKCTYL
ncbi:hypothetical protein PTNB85_02559 [Pyrenophora teres f. teres]|nr:hypothetical protein PTNB85_02559 [Pyrenophora teres f. teres]